MKSMKMSYCYLLSLLYIHWLTVQVVIFFITLYDYIYPWHTCTTYIDKQTNVNLKRYSNKFNHENLYGQAYISLMSEIWAGIAEGVNIEYCLSTSEVYVKESTNTQNINQSSLLVEI